MDESEINKLISELDSLKSEIKEFRGKLNSLDRKKEEFFREKRKISSDIYSRIKDAKSYKEKRNSLTDVVKNSKMSKEELETRIKEIEAEIHKLKEEKSKKLSALNVQDPIKLKKDIKRIEFRIETEGLTFEKEKELMKVLQKMKKQYDGVKSLDDVERKLDHLFHELRQLKQDAEMTRKIVQASAKESQKHHVELIESSKEIDELKKKEDTFEETIGGMKAEITAVEDEIMKRQIRIDELKRILNENNVRLKEDADRTSQEILKQKDEEVQEKLKKGKKLTTDDLLVLQRMMK